VLGEQFAQPAVLGQQPVQLLTLVTGHHTPCIGRGIGLLRTGPSAGIEHPLAQGQSPSWAW
jgi:hypothetical protein